MLTLRNAYPAPLPFSRSLAAACVLTPANILAVMDYTIAAVDVTVPVVFVLVYIYFLILYSGFPFRSARARQVSNRLTNITGIWCCGRIILGAFTFNGTLQRWGTELTTNDFSMLLISVFVACEVLPISMSLSTSVNMLLDDPEQTENEAPLV